MRRPERVHLTDPFREIEGDQAYESQQEFLAVAARVASDGHLSRFVYVSRKVT